MSKIPENAKMLILNLKFGSKGTAQVNGLTKCSIHILFSLSNKIIKYFCKNELLIINKQVKTN